VTDSVSPRVRRAYRLLQWGLCGVLVLAVALAVVLKVQPVREMFHPWLTIYVKESGHEQTGHFYLYDSTLGWKNVPNWTATTRGNSLTINSLGLRGREYRYQKPAGIRRILVLGDSFTWGYGVGDEDVFTEVLQRRLQSQGRDTQVINTGVSGWGTGQQYLFLKSEGFRYQPDVVVLAFYLLNDPREVRLSDVYGLSKPVFLDTRLTLGNVPVPLPSRPKSGIESPVENLELVVTLIEAIERECRRHNCRLVVMKFGVFADPTFEGLREVDEMFEAKLARVRDRVAYLDLDEEFQKRKIRTKFLIAGNEDNHWNDFGHEQVGMILGEFLDQHEWNEPVEGSGREAPGEATNEVRPRETGT